MAIAGLGLILLGLSSARAQEDSAALVRTALESGGIQGAVAALEQRLAARPDDVDATFGLGALRFFQAVEGLAQDLWRLGAGNASTNGPITRMLPIFRVPVPPNASPETASYAKTRAMLERFSAGMTQAGTVLEKVGDRPVALDLDLMKIRFDINGDGQPGDDESLAALLQAMRLARGPGDGLAFRFDTADASWLRGYAALLSGMADVFLAFDYQPTYDAVFHNVFGPEANRFGRRLAGTRLSDEEIAALQGRIMELDERARSVITPEDQARLWELRPRREGLRAQLRTAGETEKAALQKDLDQILATIAGLEKQDAEARVLTRTSNQLRRRIQASEGRGGMLDGWEDVIAFIHTINWEVTDRNRLRAARDSFDTMLKQNETTWRLVRVETDDEREWLPGPHQANRFAGLPVTDELIDGWLEVTALARKALAGALLIPTFRFGQGMNVARYIEETDRFDLVLFLTGQNVIDFVEPGDVLDGTLLDALEQTAGRNLTSYAVWFN
ncbi:hypothetical protein CSC94_00535 [Zhengella mangrovi]|uniref:Uncharacterized protein n=2 Tax=Zhengella mangrovi TaxID=1982044 RepID=A0A2G1QSS2_9HYPH|nr:hypothetical protein CSC94_00535 [Zhengella mangrovi]